MLASVAVTDVADTERASVVVSDVADTERASLLARVLIVPASRSANRSCRSAKSNFESSDLPRCKVPFRHTTTRDSNGRREFRISERGALTAANAESAEPTAGWWWTMPTGRPQASWLRQVESYLKYTGMTGLASAWVMTRRSPI